MASSLGMCLVWRIVLPGEGRCKTQPVTTFQFSISASMLALTGVDQGQNLVLPFRSWKYSFRCGCCFICCFESFPLLGRRGCSCAREKWNDEEYRVAYHPMVMRYASFVHQSGFFQCDAERKRLVVECHRQPIGRAFETEGDLGGSRQLLRRVRARSVTTHVFTLRSAEPQQRKRAKGCGSCSYWKCFTYSTIQVYVGSLQP